MPLLEVVVAVVLFEPLFAMLTKTQPTLDLRRLQTKRVKRRHKPTSAYCELGQVPQDESRTN
jgi:hypothetical protein